MLFRPQSTLLVSISINMNQFSRANFSRNALLRPQYTLSSAILFQPKVTVTAATNQSSCGRITVAAARRKGPFGRSLNEGKLIFCWNMWIKWSSSFCAILHSIILAKSLTYPAAVWDETRHWNKKSVSFRCGHIFIFSFSICKKDIWYGTIW